MREDYIAPSLGGPDLGAYYPRAPEGRCLSRQYEGERTATRALLELVVNAGLTSRLAGPRGDIVFNPGRALDVAEFPTAGVLPSTR